MQRSSVVLPEPERPNRAVMPLSRQVEIDVQREGRVGQAEAGADAHRRRPA
jgi:hypothetical protein